MKTLKILILLFFGLNICFIAQGQIDTNISNKVKLKNYGGFAYPFHDYDNNDNLWYSRVSNNALTVYQVDNNLNIIDSIVNPISPLYFKMNNKLYGTAGIIRQDDYVADFVIDSISLYTNDLSGNLISSRIIFIEPDSVITQPDSTLNESDSTIFEIDSTMSIASLPLTSFLTKENNIAILLVAVEYDINWVFPRLLIVDTLGERIALKDFKNLRAKRHSEFYISENDTSFIINKSIEGYANVYSTISYTIDKATLEAIDSSFFASAIELSNTKLINDSVFVTIAPSYYSYPFDFSRYSVKIANYNKKKITSEIVIEHQNLVFYDEFIPDYQSRIDFRNEDSIYYCTFLAKPTKTKDLGYSGLMQILNFGIDGALNFDYRFIIDSLRKMQVSGVKATPDGGLFVTIFDVFNTSTYIMKFKPNGFIGLINIETGEKEAIKVYPNPARDYINVDIESTNFKQSDIELFDMQGKLVKKAKLKSKQGNRIDVSNLNAGAYTYNVSINGKTISGKIIVGK